MAMENIKTGREDRIITLYQVDPGFYNKILSRSTSVGGSHRISVYHSPGTVPFTWEMLPGKPRDAPAIEILPPIRLPPAVRGLNMPRPCIRPTGPKAYLLNKVKKLKKIRNLQVGLPPAIQDLNVPRPKIDTKQAKMNILKSIKKVKKIKGLGKKMKGKSKKTTGDDANPKSYSHYGTDESDGLDFSNSDADDFTPTSNSSGSSYRSTFSFTHGINSPKLSRFWSISKDCMKGRVTHPKKTYSF